MLGTMPTASSTHNRQPIIDHCIYCGKPVHKQRFNAVTLHHDRARWVHQVCRDHVTDPEHHQRPDFWPAPFVDPLAAKPKRSTRNHKGQAARRMFATRLILKAKLPRWKSARFATLYKALTDMGYRYDSGDRTWTMDRRR